MNIFYVIFTEFSLEDILQSCSKRLVYGVFLLVETSHTSRQQPISADLTSIVEWASLQCIFEAVHIPSVYQRPCLDFSYTS